VRGLNLQGKKIFFLQCRILEWTLMSISEHFRYRNDVFQSDIFVSDIGITDVDIRCRISPTLRSMSMPTYGDQYVLLLVRELMLVYRIVQKNINAIPPSCKVILRRVCPWPVRSTPCRPWLTGPYLTFHAQQPQGRTNTPSPPARSDLARVFVNETWQAPRRIRYIPAHNSPRDLASWWSPVIWHIST
jgi:hypothetical protein